MNVWVHARACAPRRPTLLLDGWHGQHLQQPSPAALQHGALCSSDGFAKTWRMAHGAVVKRTCGWAYEGGVRSGRLEGWETLTPRSVA